MLFRSFLGYLLNIKGKDIQNWDLLTALKAKEEILEFQVWHAKKQNAGTVMQIHKNLFSDFSLLLLNYQEESLAEEYRNIARQMKPPRKRVRFRDTVPSYSILISAAQEALRDAQIESDEALTKGIDTLSQHQMKVLASRHQYAFAFAFAILRPLRERNILDLDLVRDLIKKSDVGMYIRVEPLHFKSKRLFEVKFPSVLVPYLEEFTKTWRPHLNCHHVNTLFLTRKGHALSPGALWKEMIKYGKKYLGIHTNPQHFRMLVASAYLAEHSSDQDYEEIRQLLGHKFISTTLKYYLFTFGLNASRKAAQFAREEFEDFSRLGIAIDLPEDLAKKFREMTKNAA